MTLAEATIALLLAGLLTLCLAAILVATGTLAAAHTRVSIEAETERVVGAILRTELRALTAADARFDSDSVRLRAFRGTGIVCSASEGRLVVRYHGLRLPEPDKDSLLLLWPDGEKALRSDGAGAASRCPDSGAEALSLPVAWRAVGPAAAPVALLVFETGAYSISGAAFRYRRGAGGRQPLTENLLSDAASSLTGPLPDSDGPVAASISLSSSDDPATVPLSWRVWMPQGATTPTPPFP